MAFIIPVLAAVGAGSAVAGGVVVAGAALAATSAIRSGQAAKQSANFNAQMADRNREISISQTAAMSIQQRRQADKQLGAMVAGYGASGVSLEGSPLDVLEESVSQAELENQNIKYQGTLRQQGYQADASLDRASGRNAQQQGYMQGASGLLSVAGSAMRSGASFGASSGGGGMMGGGTSGGGLS
jgi:Flp pilus assembly protein TadB